MLSVRSASESPIRSDPNILADKIIRSVRGFSGTKSVFECVPSDSLDEGDILIVKAIGEIVL